MKEQLDPKNLTIQFPITSKSDSILENYSNLYPTFGNTRNKVNQIANLQVILPNGKIYRTGASSLTEENYWREDGGPNLYKLFLGSGESYGIIVKGTVLLYPKNNKKILGFEFDKLEDFIGIVKDIAKLEYGEEILILNKSSMERRFTVNISKEWCILISFNEEYFENEKKSIELKHNLTEANEYNQLINKLEKNWRDLKDLKKVSLYTHFQNCSKIHNIVENKAKHVVCEMVPIEFGRSVYLQYFIDSNEELSALREELVDSNLCTLNEVTPETMKIIEKNQKYFQTARDLKKLVDKNNILNPKKWLGGA